MGIFDFMDMLGNYEDRVVANYESGFLIIDTAKVTDTPYPYETAVSHPNYNESKWVIVEYYNTKEQAQEGHNRWVEKMTTEPLPEKLHDVSQTAISELLDVLGDEDWRERD